MSRGSRPYVVTTRSAPAAEPSRSPSPARRRGGRATRSDGAKRAASRSQLWTTDSGQTTRCGPGRSRRWASVVAVLPRPMSSARQPPRPRRSRKRSQARPRRWYGRSSPVKPAGSWPPRRRSSGRPASSSSVHAADRRRRDAVDLAVAGQPQQARRRRRRSCCAAVLVEPSPGPAQRRRVDAHPAPAGVQQRGAGRLGARQLGLGDRRRGRRRRRRRGASRRWPRGRTAVRGRRRRTASPAADGDTGAHEALGTEQLDAERRQLGRRLLEEAARRRRRRARAWSARATVSQLAGDVDALGERPGQRHDLGARAPRGARRRPASSTASGVASQTSSAVHQRPGSTSSTSSRRDLPVVEGVVGHDQSHLGDDDRLTAQPAVVAAEALAEPVELVGVGETAAEQRRIGGGEGTERRAHGGDGRGTGGGQRRAPSPGGQAGAGHGVDEGGVDVDHGGGATVRGADRRHRRGQPAERGGDRVVVDGDPAGDGHATVVEERRDDEPGVHRGRGEPGDGGEPGDRVAAPCRGRQGAEPARRGGGGEAHRRRTHRAAVGERDVERCEVTVAQRAVGPRPRTCGTSRWAGRCGCRPTPTGAARPRARWPPPMPARRAAGSPLRVAGWGHRGRTLGILPTLPRGCQVGRPRTIVQ